MDFPLWEEELENVPGIEEKGSGVCVKSIGNRKWLSGASKTHNTKEQPGRGGLAPRKQLLRLLIPDCKVRPKPAALCAKGLPP